MPTVEFINTGPLTTLQDNGRYGVQHFGVSVSGAIDKRLMHYVNHELGNKPGHPVLEFALQGPRLSIQDNVIICCAGDFDFQIEKQNGQRITGIQCKIYKLESNDIISIGSCKNHTYGYIGFAHDFLVKPMFGSYSIDTRSAIGPNNGKSFCNGDILTLSKCQAINIVIPAVFPDMTVPDVIRITKGPHWNYFVNVNDFLEQSFLVTPTRNRVGMWLRGPCIDTNMQHSMISQGNVKGVIQVTSAGETVVLLNDQGTNGGYPKIAVICDDDYEKMCQMPANRYFKFKLKDDPHALS
jgi:biotin-dependent carboxylase-like uncharacterized protein